MQSGNIFVSELSSSRHSFKGYHFCRGNNSKRKTRLGVIVKGSGTYIYLGKKLCVREGDVVFIPENIFCYSEWHGEPDIEVMYVSCFIHYGGMGYEPQTVPCGGEVTPELFRISELLAGDFTDSLEAYSLFYKVLQRILPRMKPSEFALEKTLQRAIEYITDSYNKDFSIGDVARECCVSESKLYHLFRREFGQTPVSFLNSIRINVAMEHLESGKYSISEVSEMAGFNSENHFRKVFTELCGTTPSKYRRQLSANGVQKGGDL